MYKGLTNFNLRNLFEPNQNTITRVHSNRFIKPRARLDVRKYFFNNRTINDWNRLTQEAVDSSTLLSFKQNLEKFLAAPHMRSEIKYKFNFSRRAKQGLKAFLALHQGKCKM
jgi:hypothetical protein